MRFCIVGLGRMGRGMALNLLRRGHEVLGYDIAKDLYEGLRNTGLKLLNNLGECRGDVDYVILALPTGKEVLTTLSEVNVGAVILDTTTMGLDELSQVLETVGRRGLRYLTVRLEGGPRQAETGSLVMFVGGDRELFMRSEEALKTLGTPIYVGTHEQATLLKLISTSIIIANTAILAEMAPLIRELNLDQETMMKALTMSGADSAQLRTRLPWILSNNYPEAFSAGLAKYVLDKTMGHAMEKGITLPILTIVNKALETTLRMGYGKNDIAEIARTNQ